MDRKVLKQKEKSQLKLDLFGLDPLIDQNYSHSFEIYDTVGKFEYDKKKKYRLSAAADDTEFVRQTEYNGLIINVSVTDANIERIMPDGTKKRVFVRPGAREEIIEDVLRKLATERRAEAYEITSGDSKGQQLVGIEFSLYEVYEELKRINNGKVQYSYSEIREAITVLNRAHLQFDAEDGSISFSAPFLPFLAFAEKATKGETKSFVCFHPMVTSIIMTANYRRYNYKKALSFKGQYTRLIYKRLCNRWIQAGPGNPYRVKLSTLVAAMKAPYKNLYQDKALLQDILEELIAERVIESYEATPKKIKAKIVDWLFELRATNEFAKQQAASNKTANRIAGKAQAQISDKRDHLQADEKGWWSEARAGQGDDSVQDIDQIPFDE